MSYLVKRFVDKTNPNWADRWASIKHILPKDQLTISPQIVDLSFNIRENGGEDITFTCYETEMIDDLNIGSIYSFYLDHDLTRLLPCTFILSKKTLRYKGCLRWYECEGISVNDLLYRKWLNINLRNIKIRDLLINLTNQTREFIPEISNDYSRIENIDYTFLLFQDTQKYLGEIIEQIRELGFICYIDAELHIVLKEKKAENAKLDIDFVQSTINNDVSVLEDSKIGIAFPTSPITTLIIKGATSAEGNSYSKTIFGTGDPQTGGIYSLETEIDINNNFILETFDTLTPNNITVSNIASETWESKFAIYDDPIETKYPFETQLKFEVINLARSYVLGIHEGNTYNPTNLLFGVMINDNKLQAVVNGIYHPIQDINISIIRDVISKSNNNKTFHLDDVSGLHVGDRVNITGLGTTLNLTNSLITSIDTVNNTISFGESAIDGDITNVKLYRVTSYVAKLTLYNGVLKLWLAEADQPFELKASYVVSLPENIFITIFNNQIGDIAINDNGIYEVGNLALDHFFLDKAKTIYMLDENGNKVSLCASDQFPTVNAEAIVNIVETKNTKAYAQIEFIYPSVTPVVLDNSGTLNRIPLALSSDTFLKEGMPMLYEKNKYLITDFLVALNGYINFMPSLPSLPIMKTPVYINTSIPPLNARYDIFYTDSKPIFIKECYQADDGTNACNQYGYRESYIEIPEIGSIELLQKRAREILQEECELTIEGSLGFIMNTLDYCEHELEKEWIDLPSVGEYIIVNDEYQDIYSKLVMIQAISYRETVELASGINRINVGLDFGQPKKTAQEALVQLLKRFGIIKNSTMSETNFDLPCSLRDQVSLTDELEITSKEGYPFWSGGYSVNTSNKEEIEPTEDLVLNSKLGYNFLSGGYIINTSGAMI